MNEKLIEKKLREAVKKMGGLALKFTSPSFSSVPDRIVMMPGGQIWFVETKSTGKKQTVRQKIVMDQFIGLGFRTAVIDDRQTLDDFLKSIDIDF